MTLADVADRAGVSITTASVILSGREDYLRQFHPETIEKVRQSAGRLGYCANLFASGLPSKDSLFFALVIRDIARDDITAWHHWAFEGDLLVGVIHAAAQAGMYPIVATADADTEGDSLRSIERIISGGVFGAIVRSPGKALEKYLRGQLRRGQRVAVVFPDRLSQWSSNAVSVDNLALGQMAGELLSREGRKRWAIVHYRDRNPRESHLVRREGFKQVARRVGASVDIIGLPREPENFTEEDLAQLKRIDPDGVFGVDSVLSIDALLAFLKVGRRPPADFSLVGCNCSRWQSAAFPRITSVEISWKQAGIIAIRQLLQTAKAEENCFENVLMKPRTVPGETCAVPADLVPGLSET
ncbi:MAG: LacI family DNA-binding transcriptional regulator [Phycisphaerae bacterium]